MGSSFRPENPYTPKPAGPGTATVTSGPLIPVGVNADDLAALSVGTPRERIALGLGLARAPLATQQAVAARVRKLSAPGTLETVANLATGNMIAPVSEAAASRATEHDLDAYAAGGGNPAAHANLFGAAAALGSVAGNTALAGTGRAAAASGSKLVAEAPLATTALGRIGHAALSGGVTNAAIGAGSEALFGDEHGQRNVGDIVRTGLAQGAVGAAAGGALGGVSEVAGALARRLRPENPYTVHPVVEAAHDVAKEEAPDAVEQNVPTPEFRPENPYAAVADTAIARASRADWVRRNAVPSEAFALGDRRPSSVAAMLAHPDPAVQEMAALGGYHAQLHREVNAALRTGTLASAAPVVQRTVAALDRVAANAQPLEHDLVVYRGFGDGDVLATAHPSGAVRDQGFVSATTDPDVARESFGERGVARIVIPKGSRVIQMDKELPETLNENPGEGEVIIPRGGQFHADPSQTTDGADVGMVYQPDPAPKVQGRIAGARTGAVGNLGARGSTSPLRQYAGLAAVRFPDSAVSRGARRVLGYTADGRPIRQADIALDAQGAPRRIGTPTGSAMMLKSTADAEDRMRSVVRDIATRHGFTDAWDMSQLSPEETRALNEAVETHRAAEAANRTVSLTRPRVAGARTGAVAPQLIARGGGAAIGGVAGATYGASQGDTPEEKAQLAAEYGALGAGAGLGLGTLASSPEARQALSSTYRQLLVTPYAKIEHDYPDLTDALHRAGAATQAAQHIATRRTGWVTEGLSGDQQRAFTNVLLRDTNLAKADAALAREEPEAAARFQQMAADHAANVPAGTEQQQWFTDALAKHRQFIGQPLEDAAQRAGVSSVLPVQSAYLRGVSRDRLDNQELRRAMDARATANPADVQPRGPIAKAILGERPEVTRLERASGGIPQGPINPNLPTQPTGAPPRSPGATRTGSAKAAQGTAREYVSDYQTLVQRDAEDKIVRGATNDVYGQLDKAGFQRLGPKDDPPLGMQALARTVPDANGQPVEERWAVPKPVKDAVTHFEQKRGITDASGLWRKVTGAATRMQIAGMPVEATSHMNTLASIVASVPGEKDVAGTVMSAVPGVGAKAAAIREMAGIDFTKPETRQLETRLADIGALRIEPHQGGLINTSHNALFGPEGVDVRGRLVLARKYLAKKPDATDSELREFITSKLGNYSRANSGAAVNALQDSGLSAFARFQAARIPSSVRSTFGASGLPTNGTRDFWSTIGQTLYRGPLGYAAAGEAANYAMTGHRMEDNERGHQLDVQLPFTVGANNDPTYLPVAFTNPVLATGARVTGARDLLPLPGSPNVGGKIADAGRDVVNTGLGVLSPFARAASVGATGRTPYVLSDGSMLRVTNNRFDKGRQAADNLKAAVSLANPAMSAFAEQGGDLGGHRLSDALTEDGAPFGGKKAVAAKAAEFLFPRVLTLGVGGRDNALSAESRDQREYMDAMQDYTAALRRAPGPIAQEAIIRRAVKDAEADGRFAPDVVERDLRKVLEQDGGRAQDRRERSLTKWTDAHAQ